MRVRPGRPARSPKTQHTNAAIVVALIAALCNTGFVWANTDVTVVVDGSAQEISTGAETVGDVLAAADVVVRAQDLVTPALGSPVSSGDTIVVRRACPVSVTVDGRTTHLDVVGCTVADAIVAAGIDLDESTQVTPSLDTPLEPGMSVVLPSAFTRVSREVVAVPFKTVVKKDASLPEGTRVVKAKGSEGRTLKVWQTVVVDGEPGSKELAATQELSAPAVRVVVVGTAKRTRAVVARAAAAASAAVATAGSAKKSSAKRAPTTTKKPVSGRKLTVSSTAYSPAQPGLSSRTATGRRATRGVIAVDPRVIPLGTRVYVPGYGYAVAADTGGAIKGNRIDVCFDTVAEAMAWGRRTVTITILN